MQNSSNGHCWSLLPPRQAGTCNNTGAKLRSNHTFQQGSIRVQLCNCCHEWTNTHQNNRRKTFLFHPLAQTFLESLKRTPNLSVLKSYSGFSFWGLSLQQIEWGMEGCDQGTLRWGEHQGGWCLIQGTHTWAGQGQLCNLILLLATAALKT